MWEVQSAARGCLGSWFESGLVTASWTSLKPSWTESGTLECGTCSREEYNGQMSELTVWATVINCVYYYYYYYCSQVSMDGFSVTWSKCHFKGFYTLTRIKFKWKYWKLLKKTVGLCLNRNVSLQLSFSQPLVTLFPSSFSSIVQFQAGSYSSAVITAVSGVVSYLRILGCHSDCKVRQHDE